MLQTVLMKLSAIKMSAHKLLRRKRKRSSALSRRRILSANKLSAWLPVKIVSIEAVIALIILEIVIHSLELAIDVAQLFGLTSYLLE